MALLPRIPTRKTHRRGQNTSNPAQNAWAEVAIRKYSP